MLSKSKVKYIQSLSHKKARDETRKFIAEGPKIVEALLKNSKYTCDIICATKEWLQNINPSRLLSVKEVVAVQLSELEKVSQLSSPNLVLGVFTWVEVTAMDFANKFSLMLDGIRDPGNMGTIIRTADWFGINNIICSEDCVDSYNPKVVQATMGSLAEVNISYCNLEEFIKNNLDISIYAATLKGKDIHDLEPIKEGFILIGSEANGIRQVLLSSVKEQITILRLGHGESLNAAVACGVILANLTKS